MGECEDVKLVKPSYLHIALAPLHNLGLIIQPRGCRCPHSVGRIRERHFLREGPVGHQSRSFSGPQKRAPSSNRRVHLGRRYAGVCRIRRRRTRGRQKIRLQGACRRVAGHRRRVGVRGLEAPEGGVVVAGRYFGVEKLPIGAGGPEGGAVRAPKHRAAIAGVGVEAVGATGAAKKAFRLRLAFVW